MLNASHDDPHDWPELEALELGDVADVLPRTLALVDEEG